MTISHTPDDKISYVPLDGIVTMPVLYFRQPEKESAQTSATLKHLQKTQTVTQEEQSVWEKVAGQYGEY